MSEPLSGSGTAAALGGATVFGLFTGTDFGIVFGAFAGALFVATMPQKISVWRVVAHFLVSFIVGVLGARVLSAWIASTTGYDGTSADALCAVLVSVVSVKILSFIHQQDIASLVSGVFSR
ncbi:phage holin family protein, partial [Escherichia coli]|nr:phage holin family protein [Escherichia coli]MDD8702272.1 phage holin family protein [Escherichia coli]